MRRIKQAIRDLRIWMALALIGTTKEKWMDMVRKSASVDLATFANPSPEKAMQRCANGMGADALKTMGYVCKVD